VQHEHTEHVAAAPDAVFAAISDVSNLPRFVPQITAARPTDGDSVEIDARYEGASSTEKRRFTPTRPTAGSSGARRAGIAAG
jgi:ribosome-associated toxin RatA of RatAB toxin-antitoxin module